jgi:cytochrome c
MDSFEWNKIAGAVLGTFIFVLVVKFTADAVFEAPKPSKPGYVVEGVAEQPSNAGPAAAPAQEPLPDWGTVLPTADAQAGQKISARCEQCHDLSKGGPNKIGPNLWGVVGRARATHPGFSYSGAMSADHGPWTFDKLFQFLKSPQAFVPGTKMTFAGLRSAKDRIDLLAWLRTQSDSPVPIPPPAAKSPATQAPNGPAPAKKSPQGQPSIKTAPATQPKKS